MRTYGLRGSLLWAHARVQAAVVRCPRTHGRGARGLDLDAFVHRTRSTVKLPFPIPCSRPWANARSRTRVCATRVRKRDPNERATARPYCNDIASLRARQLKFVPPNHPPDHTALKGGTVHGACSLEPEAATLAARLSAASTVQPCSIDAHDSLDAFFSMDAVRDFGEQTSRQARPSRFRSRGVHSLRT